MGAKKGEYIDHINHDGLDNRKENLRLVSQTENLANARLADNNTSGYRGVIRYRGKWKAQVKYHQRLMQSNEIIDKHFAAQVRDAMAYALFGNIAFFNLPKEQVSNKAVAEAERLLVNQL